MSIGMAFALLEVGAGVTSVGDGAPRRGVLLALLAVLCWSACGQAASVKDDRQKTAPCTLDALDGLIQRDGQLISSVHLASLSHARIRGRVDAKKGSETPPVVTYSAGHALLNRVAVPDGWIASRMLYNGRPQFIQVTFPTQQYVVGIGTQGSTSMDCWVTTYQLAYLPPRQNNYSWSEVWKQRDADYIPVRILSGGTATFTANNDSSSVVKHPVTTGGLKTQAFRLYPRTVNDQLICLRLELYTNTCTEGGRGFTSTTLGLPARSVVAPTATGNQDAAITTGSILAGDRSPEDDMTPAVGVNPIRISTNNEGAASTGLDLGKKSPSKPPSSVASPENRRKNADNPKKPPSGQDKARTRPDEVGGPNVQLPGPGSFKKRPPGEGNTEVQPPQADSPDTQLPGKDGAKEQPPTPNGQRKQPAQGQFPDSSSKAQENSRPLPSKVPEPSKPEAEESNGDSQKSGKDEDDSSSERRRRLIITTTGLCAGIVLMIVVCFVILVYRYRKTRRKQSGQQSVHDSFGPDILPSSAPQRRPSGLALQENSESDGKPHFRSSENILYGSSGNARMANSEDNIYDEPISPLGSQKELAYAEPTVSTRRQTLVRQSATKSSCEDTYSTIKPRLIKKHSHMAGIPVSQVIVSVQPATEDEDKSNGDGNEAGYERVSNQRRVSNAKPNTTSCSGRNSSSNSGGSGKGSSLTTAAAKPSVYSFNCTSSDDDSNSEGGDDAEEEDGSVLKDGADSVEEGEDGRYISNPRHSAWSLQ